MPLDTFPALSLPLFEEATPKEEEKMKSRRSATAYWANAMLLGFECQQAIALRLLKLSLGGKQAKRESRRMVTEKVEAAFAAGQLALRGATPTRLTKSYRTRVRANVKRLSK